MALIFFVTAFIEHRDGQQNANVRALREVIREIQTGKNY